MLPIGQSYLTSNCIADYDEIPVSLTSISAAQQHEMPQQKDTGTPQQQPLIPPPQQKQIHPSEQLLGVELILLLKPPVDLPQQNVEAYIAGYLLQKADMKSCENQQTN